MRAGRWPRPPSSRAVPLTSGAVLQRDLVGARRHGQPQHATGIAGHQRRQPPRAAQRLQAVGGGGIGPPAGRGRPARRSAFRRRHRATAVHVLPAGASPAASASSCRLNAPARSRRWRSVRPGSRTFAPSQAPIRPLEDHVAGRHRMPGFSSPSVERDGQRSPVPSRQRATRACLAEHLHPGRCGARNARHDAFPAAAGAAACMAKEASPLKSGMEAWKVLSARSGSGMLSRRAGSWKAAKCLNSARRPLRTSLASSALWSVKNRNGVWLAPPPRP